MIIKGKRDDATSEDDPRHASAVPQARPSALIKSKGVPPPPAVDPTAPRRSSIVKKGAYTHTDADAPAYERPAAPVQSEDRVVIPTGERPSAPPSSAMADPSFVAAPTGAVAVGPPVDQQIIEEAKRRAEAIVRQAQLDAKKLLEESKIHCQNALQQAEREGFELGQQRGFEASTGEMAALILQVRQMLSDAVYAREKVLRSASGAIAQMAIQISERVTQTSVTTNPEAIKAQVAQALEKVKDREHINVRVNPQDLDVVRARRDMFHKLLEGPKTFEINGDPKVDRGGVIIETNLGNVDARISTQLQAIHIALAEVDKRLQVEWELAAQAAARQALEHGLPPEIAAQVQLPEPPEPIEVMAARMIAASQPSAYDSAPSPEDEPPAPDYDASSEGGLEAAPIWDPSMMQGEPAAESPAYGQADMGQTFHEEGA